MSKRYIVLIILLIPFFRANSQQSKLRYYDHHNLITNSDVFLDKKAYNPTYSGDTVRLRVDLKRMMHWIGEENNRELSGISIESYQYQINSGLGFSYIFENDFFKSHLFKIDYNYRFNVGKDLKISLATSLGLNHYTLEYKIITLDTDLNISNNKDWSNHPILSLGALVNIKSHEIGLTVYDLLNKDINPPDWSNPEMFKTFLVSNYNYGFRVSETVELIPEIILVWNPDVDFWILNTTASFKNRFYGGISYRSNEDFSLMFAGRPWKKFKIGYTFSTDITDYKLDDISYGFHGIQFSYMVF